MADDPLTPVSVESDDGRTLTGVGVTPESLMETVSARETADPSTEKAARTPPQAGASSLPRAAEESAAPPPDGDEPDRFERHPDGTFRKVSRGRKRFEALTAAREEQAQARQAAERERDELRQRLAAYEQRQTAPQTPQAAPSPSNGALPPTRPKPSEDQIGTTYPTYADFAEDLADWKYEQRQASFDLSAQVAAILDERDLARAQREHVVNLSTRGRQSYPDFDTVLANSHDVHFPDLRVLVNAPNAEHLIYALAKDPVLARKIATERDPIRLGYLMASITTPPAVASPASTQTVASTAPAPYQPVGSGSRTATPTLDDLAGSGDDYDKSGYRERRAAERKGSRR